MKSDEWISWSNELRKLFQEKFDILAKSSNPFKSLSEYNEKSIEKEVRLACGKFLFFSIFSIKFLIISSIFLEFSGDKILAVFREWKDKSTTADVNLIKTFLKNKIPTDNHITLQ